MLDAKSGRARDDLLHAGSEALVRAAWEQARTLFEAALAHGDSPEALEGLGMATWWSDIPAALGARERAYRLYCERADRRSAARLATALSMDYFNFRGEYAIANGWFQRADRLLDGLELCPEHGWLAISKAHLALMADHDSAATRQLCAYALSVGRILGDVDIEMLALAYEGLAFVSQGQVSEGMRRLDEATMAAVAGEMTDIDATCTTCCCLIYACEWARDYERVGQWCEKLKQLSTRWSYPVMFSVCRTHYASVLVCQGAWTEAEAELLAAIHALEPASPAQAAEGIVRLAELRCLQGRFEEAVALFERAESHPYRTFAGNRCLLGRASMALVQDDPVTAIALAERFLRAIPAEGRMERAAALELLVRAQTDLGDQAQAAAALDELRAVAATVATKPMQASVRFVEGLVAAAAEDYDPARRCFEDAVELWSRSGVPFETACAHLELARVLAALNRVDLAKQEARAALEALQQLGSAHAAGRGDALLRQLEVPEQAQSTGSSVCAKLTPRELEILRHVAQGLSNKDIADRLVLSEHTVHRHVANILAKLNLSSRVAAAAYAVRHNLL